MKKRTLNKILKTGILIFGISLLLWSCEIEQQPIETHGSKIINKISLDDFKNSVSKKNLDEISKYFQSNILAKKTSRTESSNEFTVLTDNIVMTQKINNTFFTFQLRKEDAGEEFYNLILTVNDQEEITRSEIYEYIPSIPYNSIESSQFVGAVRTYPNNSIDISTLLNNRNNNRCVVDAVGSWECSFGNEHGPGECNGTSFTYIITLIYGPCSPFSTEPELVDVNDGGTGTDDGNDPFDPTCRRRNK